MEFALVSVLVVALVLGVVQLALSLHVRNTLQDAASEGARWASLADSSLEAGVRRTTELVSLALGASYAHDITAEYTTWHGRPAVQIRLASTLPLVGLFGPVDALIVTGHSAREVRQ